MIYWKKQLPQILATCVCMPFAMQFWQCSPPLKSGVYFFPPLILGQACDFL